MTAWLHFHFSLSCIGEGNGNPLQCSCLENPRDGGAWWAAVYGVAQSRTRLTRLSSSSSQQYWRRRWHPTPVLLPGKSHGWRNLVGCSPWGCEESDMTERLHFHFSLSCTGEGNGNPLQYSCLENPMDGGACRLQSMGLRRVGHDWATSLSLFSFLHWRRKWQQTPLFLPGESQGRGSLVRWRLWDRSRTQLKKLSSSSIWTG